MPKLGGLNEYGIAAYKVTERLRAGARSISSCRIGGITAQCGKALGRDITLARSAREYDAVFLGIGPRGVNALQVEGEDLAGVEDAVDYHRGAAPGDGQGALPVGRKVVVIGGGNTAIDIAVQSEAAGRGGRDHRLSARAGADERHARTSRNSRRPTASRSSTGRGRCALGWRAMAPGRG